MKDTPDSFDRLIKSKLEEVEVNPSLADAYWQQMQLPAVKLTGTNKFSRYYWFGASVLLTMLVIFAVTKREENTTTNANAKIIQLPNKVTPINTYDTVTVMDKKQIVVSPATTKSQVVKENDSNKSDSGELDSIKNQLVDKPTDNSFLNHQTTATLNSLNQPKEADTLSISKEAVQQTGIQQANIDVKKVDSTTRKSEMKKKAPHIIW